MASFNSRPYMHRELSTNVGNQYFVITLTNFPDFLRRTPQYQLPTDHQPVNERDDAFFLSNESVHRRVDDCEQHERFLYNELTYDLEQSIRVYLQRTRRSYPINMVLDLTNIHQRR